MLDTVADRVRANLARMAEYGLVEGADIPAIVERIEVTGELATACSGADIIIEAVSENLPLKQNLFAELDRMSEETAILCSNTSVMSITQIGQKAARRHRILGMHFWNPPHLIPLVEVTRTGFTAPECMDAVCNLLAKVGKTPVRVLKDVPGFIACRMQHALWREAFALIDEGICDPETVDIAIANSFGLRLPVLGPVVNADLVGLDLTLAIHDYVLPHLNASATPSSTLRERVERGELGFKTGRGFLEWTEESAAAVRNHLTTYLLETLARAKSRGTGQ
jgi:3-hydroxybutyryl-CoA dehydrogenase